LITAAAAVVTNVIIVIVVDVFYQQQFRTTFNVSQRILIISTRKAGVLFPRI